MDRILLRAACGLLLACAAAATSQAADPPPASNVAVRLRPDGQFDFAQGNAPMWNDGTATPSQPYLGWHFATPLEGFPVTIVGGSTGSGGGATSSVTLQAGSAIAGKFGIDQTTDGTTNRVWVDDFPASSAITAVDGANVTQGAKADSPYTGTGAASTVAILKGLYAVQPALNGDGGALAHVTNFPGTQQVSGTVADSNSRAFFGEVAMTVGTTYAAGRSLKVNATAAGNVSVTYSDASTGVWSVPIGITTLPIEVTAVNSSGTTATATYSNLK